MRRDRGDRGDRGDIVLGWLTKLVVVLALVGVTGFDLVALAVGRLQAEDRAAAAANAAVSAWGSGSKDVQAVYDAALSRLAEDGDGGADTIDPASFTVAPDGTVTLTLTHTAPTLLLEKVSAVRSWATSRVTTSARPA
jgi:hypothetical protein